MLDDKISYDDQYVKECTDIELNKFFSEAFCTESDVEVDPNYSNESKQIINKVLKDIKVDEESGRLILPAL